MQKILLGFWALVILSALTIISTWHHSDFSVSKSMSKIKLEKKKEWQMIHFLGGECQCTEYIVNYLIKRGPKSGAYEKIVIFDDVKNFKDKLVKKNFLVETPSYKEMTNNSGPAGIPILVIANPNGKVEYEGGYSEQMINPFTKFKDIEQFENLQNNREIASLPAYGCYISKKYKKWLDPAGFKYKENI